MPSRTEQEFLSALDDFGKRDRRSHGARQSGKTTLAREVGRQRGYKYFSLDNDVIRAAVEADPVGFVADLRDRAIVDEIQRTPTLFTAIKAAVDRDREPGRFLLTGSANVLLVPRLADSLVGRMQIIQLFPFAQSELEQRPSRFLEALFDDELRTKKR